MNMTMHFRYHSLSIIVVFSALFLTLHPFQVQGQESNPSSRMEAAESRMEGLAERVEYLKDRQEIWDAGKRFTRGIDRHDEELIRSTLWPEAKVSHGEPLKREEFINRHLKKLAGYAAHQHHITGQTVDIDGDTAHVESYLIYFHVPRDTSVDKAGPASPGKPLASEKTYLGSGRYIDRWEKRNGEWRIVVREYVEDLALLGETVDYCAKRTCLGTWDRTDLSYERPLRHLTPEQRDRRGENSTRQTSPWAGNAAPESDGDPR